MPIRFDGKNSIGSETGVAGLSEPGSGSMNPATAAPRSENANKQDKHGFSPSRFEEWLLTRPWCPAVLRRDHVQGGIESLGGGLKLQNCERYDGSFLLLPWCSAENRPRCMDGSNIALDVPVVFGATMCRRPLKACLEARCLRNYMVAIFGGAFRDANHDKLTQIRYGTPRIGHVRKT